MHPTQILRAGGDHPPGRYGKYLNKTEWGNFGVAPKQRGIISYSLSSNRQNPLAGASSMVFNGWRRFRSQVLYWAPPLLIAYYCMEWAKERNKYLNSKAGRAAARKKEQSS